MCIQPIQTLNLSEVKWMTRCFLRNRCAVKSFMFGLTWRVTWRTDLSSSFSPPASRRDFLRFCSQETLSYYDLSAVGHNLIPSAEIMWACPRVCLCVCVDPWLSDSTSKPNRRSYSFWCVFCLVAWLKHPEDSGVYPSLCIRRSFAQVCGPHLDIFDCIRVVQK